MISIFYLFLFTFLSGIYVKYSDYLVDTKKHTNKKTIIFFGMFYGFLLFVTLYLFPQISSIWFGILLGLLLIGKIDNLIHYLGVGFFLILSLLFQITLTDKIFFIIFIIICIFEEILNDFLDSIKRKNSFIKFLQLRPLLEITTFIVSIISGNWFIWFSLLGFDLGYITIKYWSEK